MKNGKWMLLVAALSLAPILMGCSENKLNEPERPAGTVGDDTRRDPAADRGSSADPRPSSAPQNQPAGQAQPQSREPVEPAGQARQQPAAGAGSKEVGGPDVVEEPADELPKVPEQQQDEQPAGQSQESEGQKQGQSDPQKSAPEQQPDVKEQKAKDLPGSQ